MSTALWDAKRADIHLRLARDDVRDFLGWASIISTMFVGEAPYIALERAALIAAGWGDTLGAIGPEWDSQPATNLLHQAYHLMQWEQRTGGRVSGIKSIVEIGAGYGAMGRVLRARGFAGRYMIIDLPEMREIQKFYLGAHGVEAQWYRPGAELDADLLISLWGLSETSLEERGRILENVRACHTLLAYQDMWGDDLSNEIDLPARFSGVAVDIDHLPGNQYLIG